MSLLKPETLDEYFEVTGVDEELRPKYRKWLREIVLGMMPKESHISYHIEDNVRYYHQEGKELFRWEEGYNQALSDMSDRIKTVSKEEMMKYTNKHLKNDFVLTIQFHDDEDGGQGMTTVVNRGKLKHLDLYLHGAQLFDSKLLSKNDKFAIREFCRAYIERSNKLV